MPQFKQYTKPVDPGDEGGRGGGGGGGGRTPPVGPKVIPESPGMSSAAFQSGLEPKVKAAFAGAQSLGSSKTSPEDGEAVLAQLAKDLTAAIVAEVIKAIQSAKVQPNIDLITIDGKAGKTQGYGKIL